MAGLRCRNQTTIFPTGPGTNATGDAATPYVAIHRRGDAVHLEFMLRHGLSLATVAATARQLLSESSGQPGGGAPRFSIDCNRCDLCGALTVFHDPTSPCQ